MYKIILLFILIPTLVRAQSTIPITGFQNNYLLYNPAAAGVKENYICITGLSHLQWRQYTDETPTTGTEILPGATNNKQVAPETHNLCLLYTSDAADE